MHRPNNPDNAATAHDPQGHAGSGGHAGLTSRALGEADIDMEVIQQRPVAVLGFDEQGEAYAHNLRDSGVQVIVGLPAGGSAEPEATRAQEAGFQVSDIAEAIESAQVVAILSRDVARVRGFKAQVAPHLKPGHTVVVDHGFAAHFGLLEFPQGVMVAMVAPIAPAPQVRKQFVDGKGVACLIAAGADPRREALDVAAAFAAALGGARAGILPTTMEAESVARLFGAEVVARGAVQELLRAGVEVLVEAGYDPELAYLYCVQEARSSLEAATTNGTPVDNPSPTAIAGLQAGPRIIDDAFKARLREELTAVQRGETARHIAADAATNHSRSRKLLVAAAEHPMERAGAAMRELMSWLRRPQRTQRW